MVLFVPLCVFALDVTKKSSFIQLASFWVVGQKQENHEDSFADSRFKPLPANLSKMCVVLPEHIEHLNMYRKKGKKEKRKKGKKEKRKKEKKMKKNEN